MPPENHKLFPDEFVNDMLLNPEAYGMEDGLKEPKYEDDESEEEQMECEFDPNKEFMEKKTKNLHRYLEFRNEVLAGKFSICRETERDMNDIDNIIEKLFLNETKE